MKQYTPLQEQKIQNWGDRGQGRAREGHGIMRREEGTLSFDLLRQAASGVSRRTGSQH